MAQSPRTKDIITRLHPAYQGAVGPKLSDILTAKPGPIHHDARGATPGDLSRRTWHKSSRMYCRPAPLAIWSSKLQLKYWTCKHNERFNDAFTELLDPPSHGSRRTNERCPIAHHCQVGHRLRLRRPNGSWSLGSLGSWR